MSSGVDRPLNNSPVSDNFVAHNGSGNWWNSKSRAEKCRYIGITFLLIAAIIASIFVGLYFFKYAPIQPEDSYKEADRRNDKLITEQDLERLNRLVDNLNDTEIADHLIRESESERHFQLFFNALLENDDALPILWNSTLSSDDLSKILFPENAHESNKDKLDNWIFERLLQTVQIGQKNDAELPSSQALTRTLEKDPNLAVDGDDLLNSINKTKAEVSQNDDFMRKVRILYSKLQNSIKSTNDDPEEIPEILNFVLTDTPFLGNESDHMITSKWISDHKNNPNFQLFFSMILGDNETMTYLNQPNITRIELKKALENFLQSNFNVNYRSSDARDPGEIIATVLKGGVQIIARIHSRMSVDDIFSTPMVVNEEQYIPVINQTISEVYQNQGFMTKVRLLYENLNSMGNETLKYIENGIVGKALESDTIDDEDPTSINEKLAQLKTDFMWLLDMQEELNEFMRSSKVESEAAMNKTMDLVRLLDTDELTRLFKLTIQKEKEFGFRQITAELHDLGYEALSANDYNNTENINLLHPEIKKEIKLERIKNNILDTFHSGIESRMDDQANESADENIPISCNPSIELSCSNKKGCFLKAQRCDRFVDCADNSDEKDCNCMQYLNNLKICDGYEDCPFGEDEVNCHCPAGQFYCGKQDEDGQTPLCVSEELRCDNIYDCANGLDESFCFEVRDTLINPRMSNPKRSGILHSKVNGSWHVVGLEFLPIEEIGQDLTEEEALGLRRKKNQYIRELALDICDESMVTGDNNDAVYELLSMDSSALPQSIAHLTVDLDHHDDRSSRLGGRYIYDLLPPHNISQVLRISCAEPTCGKNNRERLSFFRSRHVKNKNYLCSEDPNDTNCAVKKITRKPSGFQGMDLRIVNGSESSFGEWPFILSLMRNGRFVCGATIINNQWMVTAAHCLEGYREERHFFQVIAGMLRKESRSSHQYSRRVEKIFIHPQYNSTWLSADIALAKLDKPFEFNFASSPVCLPDSFVCSYEKGISDIQQPLPGAKCISAGWGNIKENGPSSDELREFIVPILNKCVKSYNDIETQICGGYEEGGKDSCQGDSGGPLFCQHPDELDKWYLGGIISHGQGCAQPRAPGVYTRVCSYTDWIHETMSLAEAERNKRNVQSNDPSTSGLVALNTKSETSSNEMNRMNSVISQTLQNDVHQATMECPTFTCDNGMCIEGIKICDSYVDCFDGSDEIGCVFDPIDKKKSIDPDFLEDILKNTANSEQIILKPEITSVEKRPLSSNHGPIFSIVGAHLTCEAGEFRCKKMFQCIPRDKVCDMKVDCKDKTDEEECKCHNFLSITDPSKLCDGYPDCGDWSDEIGCSYCHELQSTGVSSFYCDLSRQCIPQEKMCDTVHDCDLREDERYCINIANGDTVVYKEDGRPLHHTEGLLAINTRGRWRPVITPRWEERMNNQICRYMGFRGDQNYTLIDQNVYPDLVHGELNVEFNYPGKTREKRQLGTEAFFVETRCKKSPSCGVMQLYNFLGSETPRFGAGTFPWHVNLYKDGEYICGGTLVHPEWVLLGFGCALKINPPIDWVVVRMGGHRDLKFRSAHDQFRRIVEITEISGSQIYLAMLDSPAEMNEYVNIICVPDKRWIPRGTECVITGRHEGNLKYPYETIVTGKCNEKSNNDFELCSEQNFSGECFDSWSGALACPDSTGVYYAVGVFHTDDCNVKHSPPDTFKPLVTSVTREAIRKIITNMVHPSSNPSKKLEDTECKKSDGKYRCPLGKCLEADRICDGTPDCLDGSDENSSICINKGPRLCLHLNQTHCECSFANDMRCNNNICIDKTYFCDGNDDCGDGSDEPFGCNTCSVSMQTKEPWKICDGKIDCLDDKNDMAGDESTKLCCPKDEYSLELYGTERVRCALWGLSSKLKGISSEKRLNTEPLQCVPYRSICDGNFGTPTCYNGADESDCLNIWPSLKHSNRISKSEIEKMPEDAFGRFRSKAMGYLYITLHGKSYLYCADPRLFKDEEKKITIGKAICIAENHSDLDAITLLPPKRTRQRPPVTQKLTSEEEEAYNTCVLVYLSCKS